MGPGGHVAHGVPDGGGGGGEGDRPRGVTVTGDPWTAASTTAANASSRPHRMTRDIMAEMGA